MTATTSAAQAGNSCQLQQQNITLHKMGHPKEKSLLMTITEIIRHGSKIHLSVTPRVLVTP